MSQDLEKFMELLKTDESIQEKINAVAAKYTGEQTQEAAFQNIVIPIAETAGFHITWEDCQEYMKQNTGNVEKLDPSELDQVAGGTGYGSGVAACIVIGAGSGVATGQDGHFSLICAMLGVVVGAGACLGTGITTSDQK